MLTAKGNIDKGHSAQNECESKKRIVGYTFEFAKWENRYYKEESEGKIVNIDNEIAINRQSIQSVENSIYDKALGDLIDTDKDIREFSCDCGALYGRFYEGNVCKECGTKVTSKFSMDVKRVGWIDIAPFFVINPNAYEIIGKTIGLKNLSKILQYDIQIDIEGRLSNTPQNNSSLLAKVIPYANTGMIEFRNNFEQIINYYAEIKGTLEEAKFLIANKDSIFSSKIPVSSVYLRPTFVSSKKRSVSFDKINSIYIKMLTNASLLRRTAKKEVELKRSLNVVYDIQQSLQELYTNTIKTKLSGKNKMIRGSILGNRMNFSSRMVITSFVGPYMGMDKVEMSYKGFLELNLLEIINALMKGYGDPSFTRMTVYEVMEYVQRAQYSNKIDPVIWKVMNLILERRPSNPILLLRPPSLALGSLQYFEVGRIIPNAEICTVSLCLCDCPAMNADFDGDCLSVFAIKEKRVADYFREGISPKRLIVDRCGDRYFNPQFGLMNDEKTTLISLLS